MTLHLGGLRSTLGQGFSPFFHFDFLFFLNHIFYLLACFLLYFILLLLYGFVRCCNLFLVRG